ncbi:MAG TPA: 3-dehydroquinate synthase [Verrucomicrobia bacterium]|nr:3-dehydroquinate synthase [Verrucomicrobiota bacterium]
MACEVHISLGERSYPIWIGAGVLDRLPEALRGLRGWVVTDVHVDAFHGARVMGMLGAGWGKIVLPPGESTKSAGHWSGLLEQVAESKLDRQGVLVALGGGVVGDLTGFAAATYMRGIRFVQVPTSLLAMVDSSVGGKTGINLAAGKNLAGAFHQPMAVFADTDVLATLPEREFAAGMAEAVKYGVALDAEFFGWLEKNASAIQGREPAALERMVERCCQIKAEVVAKDEREAGLRAVLNFGHTLGHAIEKATGFGSVLHGEGVALGMAYALELSVAQRGFPGAEAQRAVALLKQFGLPTAPLPGLAWEVLRAAMGVDKKAAAGCVRFVLGGKLGQSDLPAAVPEAELKSAWERWCTHVIGE